MFYSIPASEAVFLKTFINTVAQSNSAKQGLWTRINPQFKYSATMNRSTYTPYYPEIDEYVPVGSALYIAGEMIRSETARSKVNQFHLTS